MVLAALASSCGEPSGPHVGPPAQLLIVSGNQQTYYSLAELPNPIVVKVVDANGQPVPGQLVNFVVTQGGGSVFAGAALTNDTGVAQERWTLGNIGANAIEARAVDAGTGAPIVFATFTAVGVTRARSIEIVAGDSQTAAVNTSIAVQPSVRVIDGAGPVAGAQVRFVTFGSRAGTLTDSVRTTNASGIATIGSWVLSRAAGQNELQARIRVFPDSAFETNVLFVATAVAGPPTLLRVDSADNNRTGIVGQPMQTPATVYARDAYGNPIPGVAVTFAANNGGTVAPGPIVTDANGRATAPWTLGAATGIQTVVASAAGLTSATDTAIAIAFVQLSNAGQTVCGVTTVGTAYCWGMTGFNVVTRSWVTSATPVAYGTAITLVAISGDLDVFTGNPCALAGGAAVCWEGWSLVESGGPTVIPGGPFTAIAAGPTHACGLTANGSASCFSRGSAPWVVPGGLVFSSLSAGGAGACGIAADSSAYCWSPASSASVPAPTGGPKFVQIAVGATHRCALTAAGEAYCWGGAHPATPTAVAPGLAFRSIAAGGAYSSPSAEYTCVVTVAGIAYCWGSNQNGELGDGTTSDRSGPTPVAGGLVFTSIAAGSYFGATCGLTTTGAPYCWGPNFRGQIGDGTLTNRLVPTAVIVR